VRLEVTARRRSHRKPAGRDFAINRFSEFVLSSNFRLGEAADRLRVTRKKLHLFLARNPADRDGRPFGDEIDRHHVFTEDDVMRLGIAMKAERKRLFLADLGLGHPRALSTPKTPP